MGNSSSGLEKDIFRKELKGLSNAVDTILNDSPAYNCKNYSLILKSQLKNHAKIHLQSVSEDVLLVPKQKVYHSNNTMKSKDELCKIVSEHYNGLLGILKVLQNVHDMENNGEYSLFGIFLSNIIVTPEYFQISYCHNPKYIDLKKIRGIDVFIKTMLNKEEKNVLVEKMSLFLNDNNLKNRSCDDALLSSVEYKHMFPWSTECDSALKKRFDELTKYENINTNISIASTSLVIADKQCPVQGSYTVFSKEHPKEYVHLVNAYKSVMQKYKKNLKLVEATIHGLIHKLPDGKYTLRHIDEKTLSDQKTKTKKQITLFYLSVLLEYNNMLNYAKSLSRINVT